MPLPWTAEAQAWFAQSMAGKTPAARRGLLEQWSGDTSTSETERTLWTNAERGKLRRDAGQNAQTMPSRYTNRTDGCHWSRQTQWRSIRDCRRVGGVASSGLDRRRECANLA